MLLKPERLTAGTLAEPALKTRRLLFWLLTVDLEVMLPEVEEAEKGVRGGG